MKLIEIERPQGILTQLMGFDLAIRTPNMNIFRHGGAISIFFRNSKKSIMIYPFKKWFSQQIYQEHKDYIAEHSEKVIHLGFMGIFMGE